MRGRNVRAAIIAVFLLGILVFASVYYAWTIVTDIFQPVSSPGVGRTIPVEIKNGETTAQIADDLQSKGLIRNALAFRVWARIKGLDTQLQAGGYNQLKTNMTISDNIKQLIHNLPDVLYFTLTKGQRVD